MAAAATMDRDRFTTTSADAFSAQHEPDPPPPIGSRKELTKTSWKMGDRRAEFDARQGSTFKEDFPAMHGEPGKQQRTKKQLTQTNWKIGDNDTQTWSCTNTLPNHGRQEVQKEVFKKGFATRTQWKMGDNSNPEAAYSTTATLIGSQTQPSQIPAAGDRGSGPFKLTGLTAQSKGSNIGDTKAFNF